MDPHLKCSRIGCDKKGEWAVKVRVPARGYSLEVHTPLTVLCGLALCRDHASEETLFEHAPDLREIVAKVLFGQGLANPDFERAWTEPIRRTDPEFLAFERQFHSRRN